MRTLVPALDAEAEAASVSVVRVMAEGMHL
jgi:hypothetical protein